MKPSIYRSDDIVFIDVEVPQESFEEYTKKFADEITAVNMIEFRIEANLRRQRRLIYRRQTIEKKKITVGVLPSLIPVLEAYCAERGLSKSEYIASLMKWTRKRSQ